MTKSPLAKGHQLSKRKKEEFKSVNFPQVSPRDLSILRSLDIYINCKYISEVLYIVLFEFLNCVLRIYIVYALAFSFCSSDFGIRDGNSRVRQRAVTTASHECSKQSTVITG